jgi:hypothetical protein
MFLLLSSLHVVYAGTNPTHRVHLLTPDNQSERGTNTLQHILLKTLQANVPFAAQSVGLTGMFSLRYPMPGDKQSNIDREHDEETQCE